MNIGENKLIKRKMKTIMEECLYRAIPQGFSSTSGKRNWLPAAGATQAPTTFTAIG